MKFDEMVKMYLEEFESNSYNNYSRPNSPKATSGNVIFKGKPSGFKGDDGKADETQLIPNNLFYTNNKKSGNLQKKKK
jgi:hypothetical protein